MRQETHALLIGMIGFGEAGRSFARHWAGRAGVSVKAFDMVFQQDQIPESILKELEQTGTRACTSMAELVQDANVILSLVTPSAARAVAQAAAYQIFSEDALFVDLNTVPPTLKVECAGLFAEPDRYVDGGILDSFQSQGARVPIILAGPRAEQAAAFLGRAGLNIIGTNPQTGAASATKMCRSIFMKGAECLFVEALSASQEFGCTQEVLASIEASISSGSFMDWVTMLVTTHAIHADRRSEEMAKIVQVLEAVGIPPIMTEASRDRLVASSDLGLADKFEHRVPEAIDTVIDAIRADR